MQSMGCQISTEAFFHALSRAALQKEVQVGIYEDGENSFKRMHTVSLS